MWNQTIGTYDTMVLTLTIIMLVIMSILYILGPKPDILLKIWIVIFQLCWVLTVIIPILYIVEQQSLWDAATKNEYEGNGHLYLKANIQKVLV